MVTDGRPYADRRLDVSMAKWSAPVFCGGGPDRSAFDPGNGAAWAHTARTRANTAPHPISVHRFALVMMEG